MDCPEYIHGSCVCPAQKPHAHTRYSGTCRSGRQEGSKSECVKECRDVVSTYMLA